MYVIAYPLSDRVRRILQHYAQGTRRKEMSKYFVKFNFGAGFLFRANGYTLSILHALRERYQEEMDIYYADVIIGYPKELEGEIKKLKKNPKKRGNKSLAKIEYEFLYKVGDEDDS